MPLRVHHGVTAVADGLMAGNSRCLLKWQATFFFFCLHMDKKIRDRDNKCINAIHVHTLNLNNVICQLYLNKARKKI